MPPKHKTMEQQAPAVKTMVMVCEDNGHAVWEQWSCCEEYNGWVMAPCCAYVQFITKEQWNNENNRTTETVDENNRTMKTMAPRCAYVQFSTKEQ